MNSDPVMESVWGTAVWIVILIINIPFYHSDCEVIQMRSLQPESLIEIHGWMGLTVISICAETVNRIWLLIINSPTRQHMVKDMGGQNCSLCSHTLCEALVFQTLDNPVLL